MLVVDAEVVVEGGDEVGSADDAVGGVFASLVRRSDDPTGLDTAASEED